MTSKRGIWAPQFPFRAESTPLRDGWVIAAVGTLVFSLARRWTGGYDVACWAAGELSLMVVAGAFWADNP